MAKEGTWEGKVTINDGSEKEVGGVTSVQFGNTRELIDITDMDTARTGVVRDRMAGLKDGKLTVSGIYDTDSAGQDAIRTQWAVAAQVARVWRVYIGGTTVGWGFTGLISDYSFSGDVGDVLKFSCTVDCAGTAPAAF
jgi:predicted secreted protein